MNRIFKKAALGCSLLFVSGQALALCTATECNGRDPVSWGCDADAQTVSSQYIKSSAGGLYLGVVEHRYSPTCKAAWSRTTSYVGAQTLSSWLRNSGDNTIFDTYFGIRNTTWSYGDMWGSFPNKACGNVRDPDNDFWGVACTDFYQN